MKPLYAAKVSLQMMFSGPRRPQDTILKPLHF